MLNRIEKRRILLGLPDLAAYAHLLGEQAHEAKLLRQEILVRARQFFRQPQHLDTLDHHALDRIVHAKSAGQVRVWWWDAAPAKKPTRAVAQGQPL